MKDQLQNFQDGCFFKGNNAFKIVIKISKFGNEKRLDINTKAYHFKKLCCIVLQYDFSNYGRLNVPIKLNDESCGP